MAVNLYLCTYRGLSFTPSLSLSARLSLTPSLSLSMYHRALSLLVPVADVHARDTPLRFPDPPEFQVSSGGLNPTPYTHGSGDLHITPLSSG